MIEDNKSSIEEALSARGGGLTPSARLAENSRGQNSER